MVRKMVCRALSLVCMLFIATLASAAAEGKKVPIVFPGDTSATLARRAAWVEGARKERTLVWWGSATPGEAKRFISEFNKVYPFIQVDFWRGSGEETAAKLDADFSSGKHTADVSLGGEWVYLPRWRSIGLYERFTDLLPGIEKMDKRMYSPQGDWALPGNNGVVPAYNTNLVSSSDAPKSWDDLLDPKWKGHVGLTTDMKIWAVLALAEGGWGVEKTEAFLHKLRQQQLIWARGHRTGYSLLLAGEFKIYCDAYIRYTFVPNQPGDWIRVRPVLVMGAPFFLLKKAPHPNAARLFLEWTFSPQGLALYEEITGYGIAFPGAGTRLSRLFEGFPIISRTEEVTLRIVETNIEDRFAKLLGITR